MINTELYNQYQARLELINKEINKRVDYRYTGDKQKAVDECSKLYLEQQDIELEMANLELEPENMEIIPKTIPHKFIHREKVVWNTTKNIHPENEGHDWDIKEGLQFTY